MTVSPGSLNAYKEAHGDGMVQIVVWAWRCFRCTHEWLPRQLDFKPKVCPKCKSPYWDRPRKTKAAS